MSGEALINKTNVCVFWLLVNNLAAKQGMTSVKIVNDQQAKIYYSSNNTREKLFKTNAAISFKISPD
jgi:hypothetical protein